ncbi:MAG: hypothetical protein Q9182_004444 [Xanthomendoza sp. 2 TL-2023]
MRAPYLSVPHGFLLLLASYFYFTPGFGRPANHTLADVALSLPDPRLRAAPAEGPLGRMVDTLLSKIAARPEITYREATLQVISLQLIPEDGVPPRTHLSSNIEDFHDILAVFRLGGPHPLTPNPEILAFPNRTPDRWQEWGDAVLEQWYAGSEVYRSLQWKPIWGRMSLERADRLLKASGYRGRYRAVTLLHLSARPSGWCFDGLELGRGEEGSVNVEIYSGRSVRVSHCLSVRPPPTREYLQEARHMRRH